MAKKSKDVPAKPEASKESKRDKYTFKYWCDEIKRAKRAREDFVNTGNQSNQLFKADHKLDDCERQAGTWWSLVNTLLPAYFSKVPKTDVQLRKKRGNNLFRLTALAMENATQYAIEEYFDFAKVGYRSVLSFLVTGEGVLKARYEAKLEDKEYNYALMKGEDGALTNEKGEPYQSETAEITETDGRPYAKEVIPTKAGEKAILDCIHYKDYLTAVARADDEISWRGHRSYLSREEATKLFGKDAESFSYNSYPEDKDNAKDGNKKPEYEGKAELYEIWCKDSGKVYHLHMGSKTGDFLEAVEPPIDFHDFYPYIELNANIELNSSVPFGDYRIARDLILEVERLTTRIHATLQAIRANFIYDSGLGEKVEELLQGDLKGIPVTPASSTKLRGGLAAAIEFHNIDPYIKSLEVLTANREIASTKLYELLAAGDLIRGQSDPNKTATANQLESNFTSIRYRVRREQVVAFLTQGIKKIAEIIAEKFSEQTIYEMCFGDELAAELPDPQPEVDPQTGQPMPVQPLPPEVKFHAIYEVLRDDTLRNFKIDIESDSIVELDQKAERAERIDFAASIGDFVEKMGPFVEQYPDAAEFMGGMVQFVLRSYKAGKELEKQTMGTFAAIVKAAQSKSQQPDPKMAEVQAKVQIAQMEGQARQMESQAEVAEKQLLGQIAQFKAQSEVEISQQKLGISFKELEMKQFEIQTSANLKMQELQLKAEELGITSAQNARDSALDEKFRAMEQLLDAERVKLEGAEVKLAAFEKLLEERRLAQEGQEKSQPVINLHTEQPIKLRERQRPTKRKHKITNSEGKTFQIETEDLDGK